MGIRSTRESFAEFWTGGGGPPKADQWNSILRIPHGPSYTFHYGCLCRVFIASTTQAINDFGLGLETLQNIDIKEERPHAKNILWKYWLEQYLTQMRASTEQLAPSYRVCCRLPTLNCYTIWQQLKLYPYHNGLGSVIFEDALRPSPGVPAAELE